MLDFSFPDVENWFAGIGTREEKLPEESERMLVDVSAALCEAGWGLRSGAATGSDAACERGCDRVGGAKQIFLPFKGFNGHKSPLYSYTEAHEELVRRFHPAPDKLIFFDKRRGRTNDFGWKAMIRNGSQVLGHDLDDPSKAILCYTPKGAVTGGTGQALRIAMAPEYNIPVHNLGHPQYAGQPLNVIVDRVLSGWRPAPPPQQMTLF